MLTRLPMIVFVLAGCGLTLDLGARQGTNDGDSGRPRRDAGMLPDGAPLDDAGPTDPRTCALTTTRTGAPRPAGGGVDLALKGDVLLGARAATGQGAIAEEFADGVLGSIIGTVAPAASPDRLLVAASPGDFVLGVVSAKPSQLEFFGPSGAGPVSASLLRTADVTHNAVAAEPFAVVVVRSDSTAALAGVSTGGALEGFRSISGEFVDAAIALAPAGDLHVALVVAPEIDTSDVVLLAVGADEMLPSVVEHIDPVTDAVDATVGLVHAGDDAYVLYAVDGDARDTYRLARMVPAGGRSFSPMAITSIATSLAAAAHHPALGDLIALVFDTSGGLQLELRDRFDLETVVNSVLVEGVRAESLALEHDPSGRALFVALAGSSDPPAAAYIEFLCM